MKNLMLLIGMALLCLISIKTIAGNKDSLAFNKGNWIVSVGYGYPNLDQIFFDGNFNPMVLLDDTSNVFKKKGSGTFHFRGEYGLSKKIGIGISLNYDNFGGTWIENFSYGYLGLIQNYSYHFQKSITSLTGLIRFNYHFFTTKYLDPFFAFGLGFRSLNKTYSTDDPDNRSANYIFNLYNETTLIPSVAFEAVAGMRYYFTSHIGIYCEMGIAKSIIQGGVSVKL